MDERAMGAIMVLVAGAALGTKRAMDLTAEQWEEFLDRCQKESERPAPELVVEPEAQALAVEPEAPLDTGFATAGDADDPPIAVAPVDDPPANIELETPAEGTPLVSGTGQGPSDDADGDSADGDSAEDALTDSEE